MSDPIYTYLHPGFNLKQVNSGYTLLLQVYAGSFSYAVVHGNQLMAWAQDCDLGLMDEPGEHELLTYDYKNVVTGLTATGFTLVPNVLYNEGKVADIARYLDVKPDEKVFAQVLDDENHIIYKTAKSVADTAEIYGLQKTAFINKGWIEAIAKSGPTAHDLYLDIEKDRVSILYFEEGKVRFYNSFAFSNPDELAYYAAYVAQELELQPRRLSIIVSGDFNIQDNNGIRLSEFFAVVEENYLEVVNTPPGVHPHQILALTALSLCVSSEVH